MLQVLFKILRSKMKIICTRFEFKFKFNFTWTKHRFSFQIIECCTKGNNLLIKVHSRFQKLKLFFLNFNLFVSENHNQEHHLHEEGEL